MPRPKLPQVVILKPGEEARLPNVTPVGPDGTPRTVPAGDIQPAITDAQGLSLSGNAEKINEILAVLRHFGMIEEA